MKAAALAALLSTLAVPATGQTRAGAAEPITVRYRSQTSVYVTAGRAAGLTIGERLQVMDGRAVKAELEVVFLAEHSASCKVLSESRKVQAGDRVQRLPGAQGSPAPPLATPSAAPPQPAAPSDAGGTPAVPARSARPFSRATGGISAGYSTFRDGSDVGRDVVQRLLRYDVVLREVAGPSLTARLRGSTRQVERENVRGAAIPADESRSPVYEASLAYAPPSGRLSALAGRIGAYPFPSVGYVDGAMGEARFADVTLGAFFGQASGGRPLGGADGRKYGASVRLTPPGRGAGPLGLAVVREHAADGEVSREYLGLEGQLRAGRLWLYERIEIDSNRGWRAERTAGGTQLSEARVGASWQMADTRNVSVSYERRRHFWSALSRGLAPEAVDLRVHETLRADLFLSRPGGAGVWMGGSLRRREDDPRRSFDLHGGLRMADFASFAISADAAFYQTDLNVGGQGTLRASRALRGGHRVDVSYTMNRYDLRGDLGQRTGQWLRLSGYGRVTRGAFLRGDLQHGLGDDLLGTRAHLEAGYRF